MNSSFLRGFSRALVVACGLGCLVTGAAAAASAPSALVSKSDLNKLVGREVGEAMTIPEAMDDDLGVKQVVSLYSAGSLKIVVSVHTFPSAKEALAKLNKAKVLALVDEDHRKGTQVTEESGVGDRAFWAITERGVTYTVVKGAYVFTLGVGGQSPQPMASYHDGLRSLATSAVAKL